jgi:prophage regulatory protein
MDKKAPTTRLLREDEVLTLIGISRSTLYRWITAGRFPPPIHLSSRIRVWREDVIREWIERNAPRDDLDVT